MSPIRSLHRPSLALLAVIAGCQGAKKKSEPDTRPVAAEPTASPLATCRAAADRFAKDFGQGAALLNGCAPLFGDRSCREALEKAAASPGPEAGMAAINACRLAYCPKHSLAELCEGMAPPTVRTARAQFPRLAAEVLAAEHGEALGTLDAVAYLMIKPLLPPQRQVYLRARSAGEAVKIGVGESGWTGCKTEREITIGAGADLRSLDGPLLSALRPIGKGVDPGLVEVLVDPDPDRRTVEVARAASRFLGGQGMAVVTCFNDRANCPDVKRCP